MRVSVVATGINGTSVRQPQETASRVEASPSILSNHDTTIPSTSRGKSPHAPPAFAASAPPSLPSDVGGSSRPDFIRDKSRALDPTASYTPSVVERDGVHEQEAVPLSAFTQQRDDAFIPTAPSMRDLPSRSVELSHVLPAQDVGVGAAEHASFPAQQSPGYLVAEGSVAVDQSADLRASEKPSTSSPPLVGSLFARLSRLAQRDPLKRAPLRI